MPRFRKNIRQLFRKEALNSLLEKCKLEENKEKMTTLAGMIERILKEERENEDLKKLILLYGKIKWLRYRVICFEGEKKHLSVERAIELQFEKAAKQKFGLNTAEVSLLVDEQAVPNIRKGRPNGLNLNPAINTMRADFCATRIRKYIPFYQQELKTALEPVFSKMLTEAGEESKMDHPDELKKIFLMEKVSEETRDEARTVFYQKLYDFAIRVEAARKGTTKEDFEKKWRRFALYHKNALAQQGSRGLDSMYLRTDEFLRWFRFLLKDNDKDRFDPYKTPKEVSKMECYIGDDSDDEAD